MRNLALMWVLAGVAVALLAAGDGKPPVSTFTDTRDGKVYKIVRIGSQVWFAENLNYAAEGRCYDNDTSNCAKYGRLYDEYTAANRACPAGWHLPLDAEWTALENYVGGSGTAGKSLKSTSGWKNKGNGTDDYGFSALPGGSGNVGGRYDGKFFSVGVRGIWWGLSDDDVYAKFRVEASITRTMYDDKYSVDREQGGYKTFLFSIRCVQDKEERK